MTSVNKVSCIKAGVVEKQCLFVFYSYRGFD